MRPASQPYSARLPQSLHFIRAWNASVRRSDSSQWGGGGAALRQTCQGASTVQARAQTGGCYSRLRRRLRTMARAWQERAALAAGPPSGHALPGACAGRAARRGAQLRRVQGHCPRRLILRRPAPAEAPPPHAASSPPPRALRAGKRGREGGLDAAFRMPLQVQRACRHCGSGGMPRTVVLQPRAEKRRPGGRLFPASRPRGAAPDALLGGGAWEEGWKDSALPGRDCACRTGSDGGSGGRPRGRSPGATPPARPICHDGTPGRRRGRRPPIRADLTPG